MYDDQPYDDYHRSSSQGYNTYRKDNRRTPPRGPAGEWDVETAFQRGDRYNDNHEHEYSRSRSPRREGRGRYTDRDQEGYESPRNRSRSRSPYYGAAPNRTVILEGLPMDMTQEDILNELQRRLRVQAIEEVRLIKDKRTGLSRQFAFVQFVGLPEARAFLDEYYPTVSLYGAYDPSAVSEARPIKVRIAYSREKDDRAHAGRSEDDWKCDVCYLVNYSHRILCHRCNAPRTRSSSHGLVIAQPNMSAFSGFATTGDSDASPDNAASQFLLVRGLEPGVNEEILSKGISKLYKSKPSQAASDAAGSKKKISSTSSDSSLGAKEGSLQRVLLVRDRKTNESWRYGFAEFSTVDDAQAAMAKFKASERFTISSKPVLVSYIHAGVFVPVLQLLDPESEKFTFNPLLNPALRLMYWDEAAYVNELITVAPPVLTASKTREREHANLAVAAAREGLLPVDKDGEPKSKKRKVEKDAAVSNKKVVAPHLQFWTNRHAELHGLPTKDDQETDSPLETQSASAKQASVAPSETPPNQTFADSQRNCCLLCSRQFKTVAEVNKHERMSQLHKDNLQNEILVAKALAKLTKSTNSEGDMEGSVYRDRAKERRTAFNQPKQPAPQQHNRLSKDTTQIPTVQKATDDALVPSKGAALLGKMGWSVGEGLGAQGTGRTEVIPTEAYSQGVGLGAVGGKLGDAVEEASRQTKGSYADFVSKAKDKAKERFQSMA
ncbi:hypothetical protein B0O99DRAFT_504527 [Bisporella sp. PMI_857]|nr:hypothetical protein B0O99DRAFT_504527 [Bisporella sp. PMI_857]